MSESRDPIGSAEMLAVLAYHHVGEPAEPWYSWYYIPENVFAGQLRWLAERGWQVIDHIAPLEGLDGPKRLHPRAALLTFDDAHRSFREHALPRLIGFDFPAILFVPTDYISRVNSFNHGGEPEAGICGWDDLGELKRCGISSQPHSASHCAFSQLDPRQQMEEFRRSKHTLEDGLGKSAEIFLFPFGDDGGDAVSVEALLEEPAYGAACLYGDKLHTLPIENRYRLARVAMGPETDLARVLTRAPADDRSGETRWVG